MSNIAKLVFDSPIIIAYNIRAPKNNKALAIRFVIRLRPVAGPKLTEKLTNGTAEQPSNVHLFINAIFGWFCSLARLLVGSATENGHRITQRWRYTFKGYNDEKHYSTMLYGPFRRKISRSGNGPLFV